MNGTQEGGHLMKRSGSAGTIPWNPQLDPRIYSAYHLEPETDSELISKPG